MGYVTEEKQNQFRCFNFHLIDGLGREYYKENIQE